MLGGEWFEDLFGSPDEVSNEFIERIAREELKHHLGITSHPTDALSKIHKVSLKVSEIMMMIFLIYRIAFQSMKWATPPN
jgi:hypothetical protein